MRGRLAFLGGSGLPFVQVGFDGGYAQVGGGPCY